MWLCIHILQRNEENRHFYRWGSEIVLKLFFIEKVCDNSFGLWRQLDVASAHHDPGCGKHVFQYYRLEAGSPAVAERWNECARKSAAMYVASDTHNCCCVEHRVDAGFGVVAHDQSAKLQAGAVEASGGVVPQPDRRIVVLEVG